MPIYRQTTRLLQQIEVELKAIGGWHQQPPSVEALQSRQPFCVDTLSFTQWLQFIMLPKMAHLVRTHAPLPRNIAVAPMAEEALNAHQPSPERLIRLLDELDQLLSGQ